MRITFFRPLIFARAAANLVATPDDFMYLATWESRFPALQFVHILRAV
jgi:hypothetical protein